jgi:uncharacterized Zn finger protein
MSWYGQWKPYVPVARRRAQAADYAQKLAKEEGRELSPVKIEGRKIASSFWGQAWCDNLERYSDFANRLPRGRTYARNGSIIDLRIERGVIQAIVSGSQVYRVKVDIRTLASKHWECIKRDCSQAIASLIDLLQGRLDEGIMRRLSQAETGLFPQPAEIKMSCTCPDWAGLCKHVAATLYGVGARLDSSPELLFTLRNVDHLELIGQAVDADNLERTLAADQPAALITGDLGEIFGIEIESPQSAAIDSQRQKPKRNTRDKVEKAEKPATEKPKAKRATKKNAVPPKRPTSAAVQSAASGKEARKSVRGKPVQRKRIAR